MANTGGLIQPRQAPVAGNTGKLINEYYLEIEYLFDRVERAMTHYQTLGLERSATNEEIIRAYHRTISALHPAYYKVRATVPDEMMTRIDKSFNKVSQAFFVLTSSRKRAEYDRSLQRRAVSPSPFNVTKLPERGGRIVEPPAALKKEPHALKDGVRGLIDIKLSAQHRLAYTKPSDEAQNENRRRCDRFKISVPALVAGYDRVSGKWQEVTKTIDVSRLGVALAMRTRVRNGMVLHVTLPLPSRLRSHGFTEPGYNMYAIVRRVEPLKDGARVVGLEFLGPQPPRGYLHNPWAIFRTQRWCGVERRREQRTEQSEPVVVDYLNGSFTSIAQELAITENISPGGARILIKSGPAEFEMVRIINVRLDFESIAIVRNRYAGSDGSERLCLQFIERKWPI